MQHVGDRVFPIQLYVNAYRNPSEHTARHAHWCRQLTLTIGSSSSRRELEVDGEGVPGGSGRVVFRCVEGSVVLLPETLAAAPECDGKHVAFGRLVAGLPLLLLVPLLHLPLLSFPASALAISPPSLDAATAGGNVTLTLPSHSEGKIVHIKKIDTGGNTVSASTIDGGTLTLYSQNESATIFSTGSAWYII